MGTTLVSGMTSHGFRMTTGVLLILGAAGFLSSEARANEGIVKEWQELQANPVSALEAHPEKFMNGGSRLAPANSGKFDVEDLASGNFFEKKLTARRALLLRNARGSDRKRFVGSSKKTKTFEALADVKLNVVAFLDQDEFKEKGLTPVLNLQDLAARNLNEASLSESPWSDSYWPVYQGILGARYSSPGFQSFTTSWRTFHHFVQGEGALENVLARKNPIEIDALSPSEKYDLLIGNPLAAAPGDARMGFLTPGMWAEGKAYFDRDGKVETWMGICHGWAPASFMLPRPKRSIAIKPSVETPESLKFYPSDLKGLASLLWANNMNGETKFFGGRCESKKPKLDPESGRIVEQDCFDVNPAFWHLVVTNQIGLARRSMVIDATFDYEVWNQPLLGYKITFFNPQTGQSVTQYKDAIVTRAEFTQDRFKKFRGQNAASFIGVLMELSYVVETNASHSERDSSQRDAIRTVRYSYDLELDAQGEITGGEWYINQHPDFVWMPTAHQRAEALGDSRISGAWTPDQPLPKFWKDMAVASARFYKQPLAAILEPLLIEANQEPEIPNPAAP